MSLDSVLSIILVARFICHEIIENGVNKKKATYTYRI